MTDYLYPPVQQCIYCKTKTLPAGVARFTDEHIIPLAFGGSLILRQASCAACARIINQQIESPILLKEWINLRIKRDWPSRGKRRKTKRSTHVIVNNIDGTQMKIPISEYACPVPCYLFKEARIFTKEERGDDNFRWTMRIYSDEKDDATMKKKYPLWDGNYNIFTRPFIFARMLAKIGFSFAVAEYGLDNFNDNISNIVLGYNDDVLYNVGSNMDVERPLLGSSHILEMYIFHDGKSCPLLVVEIKLLAETSSPRYHVVVGDIDIKNTRHVSALRQHCAEGKIPSSALSLI